MIQDLTDVEARVLGCLIEKEITTPDYYPLTLNALLAACNQSSNRYPVMQLDEPTVQEATDSLRARKLLHIVTQSGSRVPKYRHIAYETFGLGKPAISVLCVLLLRGPQTPGELRTRSERMHAFTSLEELDVVLGTLMAGDEPFVVRLARQSGQKEVRYAHLLCGPVSQEAAPETPHSPSAADRITRLEQQVEELQRQFEQFRRQFE